MIGASLSRTLVKMSDLKGASRHPLLQSFERPIARVVSWAHSYLCKPHPELGRKGPVCPFVGRSMELDLFFLTVYPGADLDQTRCRELLLGYRDLFMDLEPRLGPNAQYKTILILFPEIPLDEAPEIIDETQAQLSFEFTPMGLMIGEFHPGPPNKPGLWNPDFRPLRCPVPMLVIRHMVDTDLLFLKRDKKLLSNYLDLFADRVPKHLFSMCEEAVTSYGLDASAMRPRHNGADPVR